VSTARDASGTLAFHYRSFHCVLVALASSLLFKVPDTVFVLARCLSVYQVYLFTPSHRNNMSIIFHSSRAILFLVAIWLALFGGGGSGGSDCQPPVAAAVAGTRGKALLPLDSAQSTFLIKVREYKVTTEPTNIYTHLAHRLSM
jgi:hypothetical protein